MGPDAAAVQTSYLARSSSSLFCWARVGNNKKKRKKSTIPRPPFFPPPVFFRVCVTDYLFYPNEHELAVTSANLVDSRYSDDGELGKAA